MYSVRCVVHRWTEFSDKEKFVLWICFRTSQVLIRKATRPQKCNKDLAAQMDANYRTAPAMEKLIALAVHVCQKVSIT